MTDYAHLGVAYLTAAAAAVAVGMTLPADSHPFVVAGAADAAATIVVFAHSFIHDNSSIYDPFWSVAPVAIALYFAAVGFGEAGVSIRGVLVAALVVAWAVRLTFNFLRRWKGLDHEDWRYADYRESYPRAYWPLSFAGFHFFPTLLVFLGCTPLYPVFVDSSRPLDWLDGLASVVTVAAIVLETVADEQLRDFLDSDPPRGAIMNEGLWQYSRHPNYLGEIVFWWGLYIFALSADPAYWWTGVGALAINLLFVFVSLPLIEERSRERRPGWDRHAAKVPRLFPWPRNDE